MTTKTKILLLLLALAWFGPVAYEAFTVGHVAAGKELFGRIIMLPLFAWIVYRLWLRIDRPASSDQQG